MLEQERDRFVVAAPGAAYLAPAVRATLGARVAAAQRELASCAACPRECRVNRLAGQTGVCGTGRRARVSSAFAHFGEEECLRGWRGSGTIFFSLCNLRCVFCQNWDISQVRCGRELGAGKLAALMLDLQAQGCHNINLVTPEHVVPQVVEALGLAVAGGLHLPVVYNTSGYDAVRSLKLLEGLIDIYMPDFKFFSARAARRFCGAPDYPARARAALREMHRQVGDLRFSRQGLACRGLLVRHLVMPGLLDETRQVFDWLARELSRDTFVNIMGQYRPAHLVGRVASRGPQAGGVRFAEINRRLESRELQGAYQAARQAGLWRFDTRHLAGGN